MAVGPFAIFLSLYSVFLLFNLLSRKKAPPNWNRRTETKDVLLVFGNAAVLSIVLLSLLSMFGIWNAESAALGRLVTFAAVSGSVFALLVELLIAAIFSVSPPAWACSEICCQGSGYGETVFSWNASARHHSVFDLGTISAPHHVSTSNSERQCVDCKCI